MLRRGLCRRQWVLLLFFETRPCSVAQTGLQLSALLPQSPERCSHRHSPPGHWAVLTPSWPSTLLKPPLRPPQRILEKESMSLRVWECVNAFYIQLMNTELRLGTRVLGTLSRTANPLGKGLAQNPQLPEPLRQAGGQTASCLPEPPGVHTHWPGRPTKERTQQEP